MSSDAAKRFKDILNDYLGTNRHISKEQIVKISKPGENFCSEIYKIDFLVEDLKNGKEESLQAIAKCLKPDCTEDMRIYSLSIFDKEINFYCEILPCLKMFQKEENFECFQGFPDVLGCRKNLNGRDGKIDMNAIIVLENLKVKGK